LNAIRLILLVLALCLPLFVLIYLFGSVLLFMLLYFQCFFSLQFLPVLHTILLFRISNLFTSLSNFTNPLILIYFQGKVYRMMMMIIMLKRIMLKMIILKIKLIIIQKMMLIIIVLMIIIIKLIQIIMKLIRGIMIQSQRHFQFFQFAFW
jgi:hypothetical protein